MYEMTTKRYDYNSTELWNWKRDVIKKFVNNGSLLKIVSACNPEDAKEVYTEMLHKHKSHQYDSITNTHIKRDEAKIARLPDDFVYDVKEEFYEYNFENKNGYNVSLLVHTRDYLSGITVDVTVSVLDKKEISDNTKKYDDGYQVGDIVCCADGGTALEYDYYKITYRTDSQLTLEKLKTTKTYTNSNWYEFKKSAIDITSRHNAAITVKKDKNSGKFYVKNHELRVVTGNTETHGYDALD